MRNDESMKQLNPNLESTHIPTYHSIRNPEHPNEMRVTGRYGETSIPASAFVNRNLNIQPAESIAYQLAHSTSHPQQMVQTIPHHPQQLNLQPHHPLPQYTYNHHQQHTPAYTLPVYYE